MSAKPTLTWPVLPLVLLIAAALSFTSSPQAWADDHESDEAASESDGAEDGKDDNAGSQDGDTDEGEKADGIDWFPGWTVGLRSGWIFSSLDELNEPALEPNGIEPIDASGLMRIEALGGTYITDRGSLTGFAGYLSSVGSDSSFSLLYGGVHPALVFPENKFEFSVGLKLGVGGYQVSGDGPFFDDAGYEGWGLIVEPDLSFRYIPRQDIGIDVAINIVQFVALTEDESDGVGPLDELSPGTDSPLDWAGPMISIGVVYGEMPIRPNAPLDPEGDEDLDQILNANDKCPKAAEDVDGFEDEDGCPELDNDKDGVPDDKDKCSDSVEDKDGFQDEDGCADPDNDEDGILDAEDKCADEAEDKDGFQDEDGCLDPDNDNDQILDGPDLCPDDAEDVDSFEDEDGCPEPDNDNDRIADGEDKCPTEAETYNGVEDDDGCPDKDKANIWLEGEQIVLGEKLKWNQKGKFLPEVSKRNLDQIAALIVGAEWIKFVQVVAHTDDRGKKDDNAKLGVERAEVIKAHLLEKGVEDKRVKISSPGSGKPLVEIEGLKGKELQEARDKNRRVEIKVFTKPSPLAKPTPKNIEPEKSDAETDAGAEPATDAEGEGK